jgi:hypothetical protein
VGTALSRRRFAWERARGGEAEAGQSREETEPNLSLHGGRECDRAHRTAPISVSSRRPVAKGGRLGARRLSAKAVCEIVKFYSGRVGPKRADFGAHSLRFLTSAASRFKFLWVPRRPRAFVRVRD